MAHKKAGGSTAWGRDSQSKRLGVKLFGGEFAKKGSILVRQRGTHYRPGINVFQGGDDTLHSYIDGFVQFTRRKLRRFDGTLVARSIVNVLPTKTK